jgi:hypothetical protein
MPIESDKPFKTCRYCQKSVVNLGLHIINAHPTILEQLEEGQQETTPQAPQQDNYKNNKVVSEDTETLIRRKLSMLMDIQIIKALGAGAELGDIKAMITPAKTAQESINEAIALHNAIYPPNQRNVVEAVAEATNTDKWLELATVAIPAIAQLLPQKRKEIEQLKEEKQNVTEHRIIEKGSAGIRRLIPQEVARDKRESSNTGGESSAINATEQPNSRSIELSDKGDI